MTNSLRWISANVRDIPSFDGLEDVNEFLQQFEQEIPHEQRMEAIDLAVKATPARWWHAHKEHIASWDDFKRLMAIRFSNNKEPLQQKYTGESHPRSHIKICEQSWLDIPEDEWVHLFIHTLDTVPRNWYTEIELRRGMITWPIMIDSFLITFTFESEYPSIDQGRSKYYKY